MKNTTIYIISGIVVLAAIVAIIIGVNHKGKGTSTMSDSSQTSQSQDNQQAAQAPADATTPTTPATPATPADTAGTTPTGGLTVKDASITLPAGYTIPSDCSNIDFKNSVAVLNTSMGTIKFQMYADDAPLAVVNFDCLISRGYYNGIIFHRVIEGFMNQGGDPTGTGTSGQSVYGKNFQDELNPETASYKAGYKAGVLAMANAGPNTNGSQFFVMAADYPLPNNYTIFGKVISGMDVVTKINQTKTDSSDKPVTPVTITSASLELNK